MIRLSPKTVRFIIEALAHYQCYHEQRRQDESLPEGELADLANDCQYLENEDGSPEVSR